MQSFNFQSQPSCSFEANTHVLFKTKQGVRNTVSRQAEVAWMNLTASPRKKLAKSSGIASAMSILGTARSWISSFPKVQKLAEHAWGFESRLQASRRQKHLNQTEVTEVHKNYRQVDPDRWNGLSHEKNRCRTLPPELPESTQTLVAFVHCPVQQCNTTQYFGSHWSKSLTSNLRQPSTTNSEGQLTEMFSCSIWLEDFERFSNVQMLCRESTPSCFKSSERGAAFALVVSDCQSMERGASAGGISNSVSDVHVLPSGAQSGTTGMSAFMAALWPICDIPSMDCTGRTVGGKLRLWTSRDCWTAVLLFSGILVSLASDITASTDPGISTSWRSWVSAFWFIHSQSWSTCFIATSELKSCECLAAYSDNHWRLQVRSSSSFSCPPPSQSSSKLRVASSVPACAAGKWCNSPGCRPQKQSSSPANSLNWHLAGGKGQYTCIRAQLKGGASHCHFTLQTGISSTPTLDGGQHAACSSRAK